MSPTLLDKFNTVYSRARKSWEKHTFISEWKEFHNNRARVEHFDGDEVFESTFIKALEGLWRRVGKHKFMIILYLADFLQ